MDSNRAASFIDPGTIDLEGTLRCSKLLTAAVSAETTVDSAGRAVATWLHHHLVCSASGGRATVLARVFVTRSFSKLDERQRRAAQAKAGNATLGPSTKCLVLMGTAGVEESWCDPHRSTGHQVIPLISESLVRSAPMISRLIEQFGLTVADVVHPRTVSSPELVTRNYNVFHVEHAVGSPYIPSQTEFVVPYGIQSVVGFGGLLRSSDLFAVILFSRIHVSPECAVRFRNVALSLRGALFRIDEAHVS